MRTLLAPTEDFIKLERSKLAADVSAGSSVSITLENNDGLADNDFVVIGVEGSEKAELCQISASVTPGATIVVGTLKFAHKAGEPIVKYRYDKRKFYGSATAGGSYSELTSDGSPKTIGVDDPQGTFLEYTGGVYEYFKATYYNSETTEETDTADSREVLADESKRYASIYGIRKMAGFTQNPFISDARIEDKRMQAENEINSSIVTRYNLPLSSVPPLLTYVCECLAAGYMHYEEYGPEGDAVKKLGEARAILKAIQDGKQRLLGEDYIELDTAAGGTGSSRVEGYPDSTEGRKFSMSQRF